MTGRMTQNQLDPSIEITKRSRHLSVGSKDFDYLTHGANTRMGSGPECWKLDYSNKQQGLHRRGLSSDTRDIRVQDCLAESKININTNQTLEPNLANSQTSPRKILLDFDELNQLEHLNPGDIYSSQISMKNEFSNIRHKPCMGRRNLRPIDSSTQSSKSQTFQQKAIKLSKETAQKFNGIGGIPENLPQRAPGFITKPKWKNYRTQNEEIANRLLEKYRGDQELSKATIIGEIYPSQDSIKKSQVTTEGLSPRKTHSPAFGDLYKGDPFGLDPRNWMAEGGHGGHGHGHGGHGHGGTCG